MKTKLPTVSRKRLRKDDVEMIDKRGKRIFVRASASIPDLFAAGVRDIGFRKRGAPKKPNYYYSTP